MLAAKLPLVALLVALAAPAFAQPLPADPIRLTPEQQEAALATAQERTADDLPINGLARGVHGEMGVEIGSNGSRAAYGTAIVPLGENGTLALSYLTGRTGRWRPR